MSEITQRLVAVVAEYDREIDRLRAENEQLLGRVDALCEESVSFSTRCESLSAEIGRLARARAIVDEQAEDEGLWCPAVTATEAYLQQELRRLHAAVEGDR